MPEADRLDEILVERERTRDRARDRRDLQRVRQARAVVVALGAPRTPASCASAAGTPCSARSGRGRAATACAARSRPPRARAAPDRSGPRAARAAHPPPRRRARRSLAATIVLLAGRCPPLDLALSRGLAASGQACSALAVPVAAPGAACAPSGSTSSAPRGPRRRPAPHRRARGRLCGRGRVDPQIHAAVRAAIATSAASTNRRPRAGVVITRPWKMSCSGAATTWCDRAHLLAVARRAPARPSRAPRRRSGRPSSMPASHIHAAAPRSVGLPTAGISRRCAWCSSVAAIARSTCPSAGPARSGASVQRARQRLRHEAVGLLAERERAGLARRADDAAGRAREADQVLALAAARARAELRREARREQQLQAERERRRAPLRGAVAPRRRARRAATSWRQSRLKTPGCGSEVSNSRPTASQARAAASSARPSPRSRA